MRRLRRWLLAAVFVAGMAAALAVLALDRRVQTYLAGPPLGGVRIYAAPVVLRAGAPLPGGSLERKLARLGYVARRDGGALAPGEYRAAGAVVDVAQRPSPAPWSPPPRAARVLTRAGRVTELRAPDGSRLDALVLEPEMLAVVGGAGPALGADVEAAPGVCRDAVLAAEDRHFFRHPGIDPVALGRALLADLRAGAAAQGGSTLTQQLVKNAFLTPRRTLARKLQEAVLAVLLERRASKEEILQRYLSSVYLGVEDGLAVHGFAQAAPVYFGKPLADLDAAECALLAGIVRAPNGLAPRRHAAAARARRDRVLTAMERDGALDAATAAAARATPLALAPPRARSVGALYVAAEVGRQLARLLPEDEAEAPGLAVFTGVDGDAQREAERAVRRGVARLEGRRPPARDRLQAALVALDVPTGRIRALVGGRDYATSQLDRAVAARRQPGSAFKPVVYMAALDPARRASGPPLTVASLVADTPLALRVGKVTWRPENYDRTFLGLLSVEDALADSRNAATVRVALDVGIDAVAGAAADLGLGGPLPRVPALALGAAETSLLELTSAYEVFAAGGVRRAPVLVEGVVAPNGETLYAAPRGEARVVASGVAYLVTHLLEAVVDHGTGRPARDAGLRGPAAGKTGTTDDTRDAWFVGYTPSVVAGVWVGRDAGGATGFTGAQAALPIWTEFVRAVSPADGADAFAVPDDVVWRDVDPASGELAGPGCPATRRAPFLTGTEPRVPCHLHRPALTAVGDRIEDAVRHGGQAVGSGGRRLLGWFGRLFR
jgi:penicillin-binding protein 1B